MGKRKFEIGDIVMIDKAPMHIKKDLQNRSKTHALFVVTNYNGWPGEYSVSVVSTELAQEISTEFQKVKSIFDRKNKLHKILMNYNKHMNQYEHDGYKLTATGLTLNRNLEKISIARTIVDRMNKNIEKIENITKDIQLCQDMLDYIKDNGEQNFSENSFRTALTMQNSFRNEGIDADISKCMSISQHFEIKKS